LRDIAGFGGAAEVLFASDGDDIFEFGKCHARIFA
jgi:hypothetical protein